MPLPFFELVGVALGAALAWASAPELARATGPLVASRPFLVVLAFTGFVWVPVAGYFAAFYPDWSMLYLASRRDVPSAARLALVLASGGLVVSAFCASARPVCKRRYAPVIALVVGPLLGVLVGVAWGAHRLALDGTYAQVHGDVGAEPIGSSGLGRSILFMAAILLAGVGWTVRSLLRLGRDVAL